MENNEKKIEESLPEEDLPVVNEITKKIIKKYEIQIRETLVKAIDTSNLLKDGKQIIAFNKLNGVIQKLNSLYDHIKNWNKEME